jgi:hypothetical protein
MASLRADELRDQLPRFHASTAVFLTEPLDNRGWEWHCYMRDPDGYLIEVGQHQQPALDYFKTHSA